MMRAGKSGVQMARPTKWRKIEHVPTVPYFVPSKTEEEQQPENILKLEELEAIRLKDLERLEQAECAEKMEISRPTLQHILLSAREKVADSLINGKVIRIEGGNFTRNICPVLCEDCGKEWKESIENLETVQNGNYICPKCGSEHIVCQSSCGGRFCRKSCRQRRTGEDPS